ncbi:MAG: transcriptional regulator [Marinomonas sp.]|jgi:BolA protein|uniref:BolA protein family transcriptional regulator n=2 Tax=Marinomonas TaxID=28253 RepID=A0A4R6XE04_9GAMM|nr:MULTISPECIES: BolA/IbaG family iron-sulfur metabolism protein [Marinomonas]MAF16917.1 transcriptional regulator [Marinomonas sp.]MEC8082373.1 BolA/IbaG family iron-sulfur metabolism protein [Pseudomonadota bacterium]MBJ7549394.1 BolA/IbaG family iron-sulfur metabolism protein [Marinomonas ostreistagni]MCC4275877.1 BolA/IbaG family iron-sulfur metabolism protein [Marinomonas communis]MEC8483750.1 BolA/IbaG family iron-sulfur metabolism protein [Pseudomonadota bacterium]
MSVENEISETIQRAFNVHHIELENESYKHNVPEGSESHFKLTLVSNVFVGKRAVQRHQLVYGALTDQMKKIHALALHLYTDEEWEARRYESPQSPNCMGGGH